MLKQKDIYADSVALTPLIASIIHVSFGYALSVLFGLVERKIIHQKSFLMSIFPFRGRFILCVEIFLKFA